MQEKLRTYASYASEFIAIGLVPVVLAVCTKFEIAGEAALTFLTAAAALLLFFAAYEWHMPQLRDIMPTAVMAALAAAGRILFAPLPDVKPVSAIAIITGSVFGRRSGFMVGALAALVSNFFFGQGAWTPWQMYAWGFVGWGAGALAQLHLFQKMWVVYIYGAIAPLMYGFILNMWSILNFFDANGIDDVLKIYAAALPLDITHAIATILFLTVLFIPWRKKLERIRIKFGIGDNRGRW
ncbi:MAG: ECF transporter S component [Eggerthellaceae bacterium]|nr:ECF transporter S component [Eggerthellaceae bacterium]